MIPNRYIYGAFGLGIGALIFFSPMEKDEIAALHSNKTCEDQEAVTPARAVALDRLKAPSTADFQPREYVEIVRLPGAGCRFRVSTYVDSENSFGAKLRTRYSVEIEKLHDTGQWAWKNFNVL